MYMEDVLLIRPVVPYKDGAFAHHFQVGPFLSNINVLSAMIPFMRVGDDIVCPREVVDIFEICFMDLACIILQVQKNGDHSLGFGELPMPLN